MQLAYFAFVAHTFDLVCLHRVCLHTSDYVSFSETELSNAVFAVPASEVKHSCESDCELCYDSPEIIKATLLSFLLFVLWKVCFSTVRCLTASFYWSCVPLGLSVFLFFESLLI